MNFAREILSVLEGLDLFQRPFSRSEEMRSLCESYTAFKKGFSQWQHSKIAKV